MPVSWKQHGIAFLTSDGHEHDHGNEINLKFDYSSEPALKRVIFLGAKNIFFIQNF